MPVTHIGPALIAPEPQLRAPVTGGTRACDPEHEEKRFLVQGEERKDVLAEDHEGGERSHDE